MKKTFLKYSIVVALLFVFHGCDIIEEPIVDFGIEYREDLYGAPPTFESLPIDQQFKHAVLEDFTGHKCGNCPDAHEVGATLKDQYGDSLSILAIHATGLADPDPPEYPADYRTAEGNAYWVPFAGLPIPIGRINREGGMSVPWPFTDWSEQVDNQFGETPIAVMQMQTEFIAQDKVMNVHLNTEFIQATSASYKFVILITESHIISPQLDYNPTTFIEFYEHNFMLRGSVSGAFGLELAQSPGANSTFNQSYTYNWNSNWIPENCTIVAFVYDTATEEIINSVESQLIE